jgi:NodT family efflux transporter outer membrane factor (OMF) lipoprotein
VEEAPGGLGCRRFPLGAAATGLLVAALALTSCAVGPDFKRPDVTVSADWHAVARARNNQRGEAEARWWKAFNDPVLDRLIEVAYRQNLPLQAAGLRIVEARAQLAVATGLYFPQQQAIVGEANAVGLSNRMANIPGFDRRFGVYQLGFDAAWELDLWGKYRRGVESETAVLLASITDYEDALVSLTAEVARIYVTVRGFEVLLDQATANVRVQDDGFQIAQSRFKNGATSELDPTQATTLLESTRATIPQIDLSLQQARNALATLLGQPAGTVEAMLAGPRAIPRAPAEVAVGLPAEMLRRRPDIRGAELMAAAQCARIGVAKAELFPSFSIAGTVGLLTSTNARGVQGKFLSTDSLFYIAGPRLNWPFLNYGRLKNGVRVQDARFQQLLVTYRQTVLKAAQEVEDALVGFLDSRDAATFHQNAVTAAQRSVDLSVIAYREGATDFQRVLDAQRSLLREQQDLAQSATAVATHLIAVYKALGGGWEVRAGDPIVPEATQREMEARTNWGDMLTRPRKPERQPNPSAGTH